MRKLVSVIPLLLLLVMSGCGSDSKAVQTPPSISNLHYSAASLRANTVTDVTWQVDFADLQGNISTGTYIVYNPSGTEVDRKTISLTIPPGTTTGTQSGTIHNVTFLTAGTYTATMFVTDSTGRNSNTMTATFTIEP